MEEERNDKVYLDFERVPLRTEREEIRKKRRGRILVLFLCLLFLLIGLGGGYLLERSAGSGNGGSSDLTLDEIRYLMEHYYLYSGDHEDFSRELREKAYYGMTTFTDDPYTGYMSKEEMDEFSSSINMNYVGIGVEYSSFDDMAMVVKVFKDSPAEKAGMLPGDILETIEGVPVSELDSDGIKKLVLGEEGTVVKIAVSRGNEKIDLDIVRGTINSTVYAYAEDDYVVLELNSFGEDSALECTHYLDDFASYSKIIIDLRNNSGGYQTAVKDICALFIGPDKVYLKQKGADGKETAAYTTGFKKIYSNFEKIVIITNESTASAAEVFAICLKEQLDDVTIVGTTTYGKGVIQTNHLLSDGGALKMTTYYWYSPNGISIDKEGVKPDIEVRMPEIYYETYTTLADDEYYEYDSVSDKIRIMQLALQYLDYGNKRSDGYFDEDFLTALDRFKQDNGIEADGRLDRDAFETAISLVSRNLSLNEDKDTQLQKAKELMYEN